jgi:ribosomal-protein-alanine N-acetyltransferase
MEIHKSRMIKESLSFAPLSRTVRMYRGRAPAMSSTEVYGLACLELG